MITTLLFLLLIILIASAVWSWKSTKTVRPNEVAVRLYGGTPGEVFQTGLAFVPKIPVKVDGHDLFELVRIPKDMFKLPYEFDEEHQIFSQDYQLLFPHVTLYIVFPYDEPDSLRKMLKRNVPLTEAELTEWAEDVVIPALKIVLARHNHEAIIGERADLKKLGEEVVEILRDKTGVFYNVGITGENPADTREGTGFVSLEIEQVSTTKELQEAIAAPVIAKKKAAAAKDIARLSAEEVAYQILGIVAVQYGMTIEQLQEQLKADPKKREEYKAAFEWAQAQTTRDRAGDGFTRDEIDVSSGGKSVDGSLPGLAALFSLMGRQGRGGGSGGQGKPGGKKKSWERSDAERRAQWQQMKKEAAGDE